MNVKSHLRSESDRSDDEKAIDRGLVNVEAIDLPADPDAHLSAAERAAIVRLEPKMISNTLTIYRTESLFGN